MNYSEEIQELYQSLGSTMWELPGFPRPERTSALELPHIGPDYSGGGVMFLQSDPQSVSPVLLLSKGIEEVSQSARGALDFLFVTALAAIFLEHYGPANSSTKRVDFSDLDLSNSAGVGAFISSLDHIAFGRMSQAHPEELSGEQRRVFHEKWLKCALKGQIEILQPFYFVVFGKSKAAWEIVSHACGATAWRRETDGASIGHIIALHERQLIHEVIFVERKPTNPEELKELLADFRRFIEGGKQTQKKTKGIKAGQLTRDIFHPSAGASGSYK